MSIPATTSQDNLDYFQKKAQRRREAQANARDAKKAMKLYSIDNAVARRECSNYPNITNFVERIGGQLIATDYARSRFSELA